MPTQPLDYEPPTSPQKPKPGPLMLGGIVLFIYPFCFIANIMSLAAVTNPEGGALVSPLQQFVAKTFLWGATIYPAVYLAAAGVSLLLSRNDRPVGARRAALVPLIYLAGLLVCFTMWAIVGP